MTAVHAKLVLFRQVKHQYLHMRSQLKDRSQQTRDAYPVLLQLPHALITVDGSLQISVYQRFRCVFQRDQQMIRTEDHLQLPQSQTTHSTGLTWWHLELSAGRSRGHQEACHNVSGALSPAVRAVFPSQAFS